MVNVGSQLYGALITLVMVPVYINWMGAEAYGLVGVFAMLQGWFTLLDLGLSPAFSRQVARYRGGAVTALELRQLLRAVEWIFLAVATVGSVLIVLCADLIATHWLHAERLTQDELVGCLTLMAMTLGVRWMAGLYRAVVTGYERMVWLGWVSVILATLRAVGVLLVFIAIGTTPTVFFAWQLALMVVELGLVAGMAYGLVPVISGRVPWSWAPLREVLGLSLSFAFLVAVWTVVTNLDKVLLSTVLTLSDYAVFTVAVLAASGVAMISNPVGSAVQPRLARLEAEGDKEGLIALYRKTTQVLAATAFSAAIVLAFHAEGLLWAWTGDRVLAAQAAPVLTLYALSYGLLAMIAPTYQLQVAKGNLSLHMIGNVILAAVLTPAIVWATLRWGAVGSGWVWLICQAVYLFAWVPLIHARFAPGLHLRWVMQDVLPMALSTVAVTAVVWMLVPAPVGRLVHGIFIIIASLLTLVAGVIASPVLRMQARDWWTARFSSRMGG